MKERPILFSAPTVRAILDGRKTQTRRVLELPRNFEPRMRKDGRASVGRILSPHPKRGKFGVFVEEAGPFGPVFDLVPCRYAEPDDVLWVRETWASFGDSAGITPPVPHRCQIRYHADNTCLWRDVPPGARGLYPDASFRLRPSCCMPRWASRITLEVENVRVERVQDISEADAVAEGCTCRSWESAKHNDGWDADEYAANVFSGLWDSINAERGFGWDSNPWVWVVSFSRVL